MPQLVHIQIKFAIATASHGHILKVHMNEHTRLNKVMNFTSPRKVYGTYNSNMGGT